MTTSDHLYELVPLVRERMAAAARDGSPHPLQPSWFSLSRLLYYTPPDQALYRETAAEDLSSRPTLVMSLGFESGAPLTLQWCSPSSSDQGALTLLRPPGLDALFDVASPASARQRRYDEDRALFARLVATLYRSLIARFEEQFALEHESWLVLHRSPVASLEVVGEHHFAAEPAEGGARSELEAYTDMRLTYLKAAFRRARCLFPVLHERLEEVSGRSLDAARLRALCQAHDAEQMLAEDRITSPDNTTYLTTVREAVRQLQAGGRASPERMAGIMGCAPNLVAHCLAELEQ